MNRRDLFRGAGALALASAVPAPPVEAFTGITPRFTGGLDLSSTPDSTSIWVVSWGKREPRLATPVETLYFMNESGRMQEARGYMAL